MSGGQVKIQCLFIFSLTRTSYLVTGQVKILMYLPGGQVNIFRFFYPCVVTSGCRILDERTVLTVSIDQRLSVWQLQAAGQNKVNAHCHFPGYCGKGSMLDRIRYIHTAIFPGILDSDFATSLWLCGPLAFRSVIVVAV